MKFLNFSKLLLKEIYLLILILESNLFDRLSHRERVKSFILPIQFCQKIFFTTELI